MSFIAIVYNYHEYLCYVSLYGYNEISYQGCKDIRCPQLPHTSAPYNSTKSTISNSFTIVSPLSSPTATLHLLIQSLRALALAFALIYILKACYSIYTYSNVRPARLPSRCLRGEALSVSFSCPRGAFPSTRHDRIRDLFAAFLTEVCPNVSTEPALQPISRETFSHRSANMMMVQDGCQSPESLELQQDLCIFYIQWFRSYLSRLQFAVCTRSRGT